MRHLGSMAAAVCALVLVGPWAATHAAARDTGPAAAEATAAIQGDASKGKTPPARPALWRTYDMLVNFQNLPRTYTCDQLWYEFHGILLQLGAWPYSINILPYHCSPSPSGDMRSPDVQVRFQLPFFLEGAAAKWAPAKAIERTIRLAPGEPKTLHPSDCQLLQQISQTLLASLPVRVGEQHFDCSAPPRQAANFKVAVSLPVAVQEQAVTAVRRPSAGPAPH
jgi:hypothetical protein